MVEFFFFGYVMLVIDFLLGGSIDFGNVLGWIVVF